MNLDFNKKTLGIAVFLLIMALGIFLRSYNFSDWLHFELDQSRDANFVSSAVTDGVGNLPTLGPKAAGTYLRLGPAFYYFEYLSALVFGDTPAGHAMIVLLFSIASMPLFYLLVRRYFNQAISLALLAVWSVSLFITLYSRFSWNPNLLPFFILLAFYSLLRMTEADELHKERWLIATFFAVTIVTQLHFLALMLVPPICVAYYLLRRTRIYPHTNLGGSLSILRSKDEIGVGVKWWAWVAGAVVVLTLYAPVIITDIKTGGENWGELKKTLFSKSSDAEHTLPAKVVRTLRNASLGYYLVVTGDETAELPEIIELNRQALAASCGSDCRTHLFQGVRAIIFFLAGSVLVFLGALREQEKKKRDFLQLMAIWLALSSLLFVPLAFNMFPRFFLLISPLAMVMLGLIFEKIYRPRNIRRMLIVAAILTAVVTLNLRGIFRRFDELDRAKAESFDSPQDRILRELVRVTLEQQNTAADIMAEAYAKNNYPVYIESETTYKRSLSFLLKKRGVSFDGLKTGTIYKEGNHFLVLTSVLPRSQKTLDKFLEKYSIAEQTPLGTLVVYRLAPKLEAITAERQDFSKEKKGASSVPERYTWNDLFEADGPVKRDAEEDEGEGGL